MSSASEFEVDAVLQAKIKKQDVSAYENRMKMLEEFMQLEAKKTKVEIEFGNRHYLLSEDESVLSNRHQWTMFVRAKNPEVVGLEALVEKVVYKLHPTFNPDTITRYAPPYEIEMCGWGTFTVGVSINFLAKYGVPALELEHGLSFAGAGKWRSWAFKITLPAE